MDDSFRMSCCEATSDLHRIFNRFTLCESVATHLLAQRCSFQQFRHDIRRSAVSTDIIDRKNVWMIELPSRSSFLLEATQPITIRRESGRKHLHCYLTPQ